MCRQPLFLVALGLFLGALSSPAFATFEPRPVHGVWVWKTPTVLAEPRGAIALRDFCLSEGVNEVYLSLPLGSLTADEGKLVDAIALLHPAHIRVEALLSSIDADEPGEPRDSLRTLVQDIVAFNQKHLAGQFDGIHLDIEPWQRPENRGPGNLRFLPGLVEAYRQVASIAQPAGMTVNADIAVKLLRGDSGQREALLSSLPRLTLMMYELTSPEEDTGVQLKIEQVKKTSQKDLAMAYEGLNKRDIGKLVIALQTIDYGNSLQQMLRALDDANHANPRYLGWARHSYNDTLPTITVTY